MPCDTSWSITLHALKMRMPSRSRRVNPTLEETSGARQGAHGIGGSTFPLGSGCHTRVHDIHNYILTQVMHATCIYIYRHVFWIKVPFTRAQPLYVFGLLWKPDYPPFPQAPDPTAPLHTYVRWCAKRHCAMKTLSRRLLTWKARSAQLRLRSFDCQLPRSEEACHAFATWLSG